MKILQMKTAWYFYAMACAIAVPSVLSSCKPVLTTDDQLKGAAAAAGIEFTEQERDSMQDGLKENLVYFQSIRSVSLPNDIPPALQFNPLPVGFIPDQTPGSVKRDIPGFVALPENLEDLAYYDVASLSALIRDRKVTSVSLTRLYLDRIKKYDSQLHAVITLTEDLAIEQAKKADEEIAAGHYRGPLHGIPYGTKDLLALEGYPTTWGSDAHRNQVIDRTSTVIRKLEEAGAVHLAKLSLGALAWGDVWFDAMTRNPWDTLEGSSGSSAGPASATAAGLVAFSIGSETWGSIVSPSTRCGTTGLRPTYGRVSRTGAMALSWSMDKLGPICRSVEDCALVFDAIQGADNLDQTLIPAPFSYDGNAGVQGIRIGYVPAYFDTAQATDFDRDALAVLRKMGVDLIPVELPESLPVEAMSIILSAEAAAAFDELTRSNRDDLLRRQIKDAWPNVFRTSRLIPAVEYINANRLRFLLIQKMQEVFEKVDVIIVPSFAGNQLLMTNLTGHPCLVLPNGFNSKGTPVSISFIGRLFGEGPLMQVARAYQQATGYHLARPPLFP
jgi:Asp-tRNA(Asn)/Glu-tRNA(Gln) amidotransferase A subunit family amidase